MAVPAACGTDVAEAAGVCWVAVGGVLIRLHADASSASPSILVNKIDFFISVSVNRRRLNLPVSEPSKAPCEHLIFSNIILMAND